MLAGTLGLSWSLSIFCICPLLTAVKECSELNQPHRSRTRLCAFFSTNPCGSSMPKLKKNHTFHYESMTELSHLLVHIYKETDRLVQYFLLLSNNQLINGILQILHENHLLIHLPRRGLSCNKTLGCLHKQIQVCLQGWDTMHPKRR